MFIEGLDDANHLPFADKRYANKITNFDAGFAADFFFNFGYLAGIADNHRLFVFSHSADHAAPEFLIEHLHFALGAFHKAHFHIRAAVVHAENQSGFGFDGRCYQI